MKNKINCWEFKKCGREPGGKNVGELGICIAAIDRSLNGVNGGINGGRICWALAGTLCGGKVQGTFALKLGDCLQCDFYRMLIREAGENFQIMK